MTPQARGQLLQKLGELFYREIDTLAAVEALDNGKAFSIAKGDVAASADCLKYYGGWSDKIHGKVIETDDFSFRYTRHELVSVDKSSHGTSLFSCGLGKLVLLLLRGIQSS